MPRGVPRLGRRAATTPTGPKPPVALTETRLTGVCACDWFDRHYAYGRAVIEGDVEHPVVWITRVRADWKTDRAIVDDQGRVFMLCFADYDYGVEIAPTWEVRRYPHLNTQSRWTHKDRSEAVTTAGEAVTA